MRFYSIASLLIFSLLQAAVAMKAEAQGEGFHYVPLRSSFDAHLAEPKGMQVDFTTTLAFLGERVYGGTGGEATMYGIGTTARYRHALSSFVHVSPQFGLHFFFGKPVDNAGDKRDRLSLQAPLGLHYAIQMYRDDRQGQNAQTQGRNVTFYAGPLFPLTLDLTTDGFSASGDLGAQTGLQFSQPVGTNVFAVNLAAAKFFTGFFYVNDRARDDLQEVTGEPIDLAGGIQWLSLTTNIGLAVDYHWTSSLADLQGDTIYMANFKLIYVVN